jgi:fluoroacetyl-CoA thioesterase
MVKKTKPVPRGLEKTLVRPVEFRRTIAYYDKRLPAVLSTPSMIGQMEVAAAMLLQPFLPRGAISLGTHINVSHRAAATAGERLRVTASFDHIYHPKNSGRLRYVFNVEARVGKRLVGEGRVERAVVERSSYSRPNKPKRAQRGRRAKR